MTPRRVAQWPLFSAAVVLAAVVGLAGCTPRSSSLRTASAFVDQRDARELRDRAESRSAATAVLRRFLDASVETVPKDTARLHGVLAEDESCWSSEENFRSYWLAESRILSVAEIGDSATARVEITSVARQEPAPGSVYGSIVTRRVARDTVEFLLIREGSDRGWRVCGDTRGGWDFGSYGTPGNVSYRPAGTSKAGLYQLVDSIRGTHQR
jgi:hypothetical protein